LLPSWLIQQHLCQRIFSLQINGLRNVSAAIADVAGGAAKKSDSAARNKSKSAGNFPLIGMSEQRWDRFTHTGRRPERQLQEE
jgi:hypothetical protein